jgi:hypothetical protein
MENARFSPGIGHVNRMVTSMLSEPTAVGAVAGRGLKIRQFSTDFACVSQKIPPISRAYIAVESGRDKKIH